MWLGLELGYYKDNLNHVSHIATTPRRFPRKMDLSTCGTIVVIRFVGERQSENSFVYFARNPHKGLAHIISYETERRRGKARSQSSEQIGVSDSQGKATVREREVLDKARSWELWTQKPGQQMREDVSAFLLAVWEFLSGTRNWLNWIAWNRNVFDN